MNRFSEIRDLVMGLEGDFQKFYDKENKQFKVNAIQSEACPIQLSINNNRDGNFQYVNALASPLNIIEEKLKRYLNLKTV